MELSLFVFFTGWFNLLLIRSLPLQPQGREVGFFCFVLRQRGVSFFFFLRQVPYIDFFGLVIFFF